MEEIIALLKRTIEESSYSKDKNRALGLLIQAKTIEILRPQAEQGTGFAMAAIAKIAASISDSKADACDSNDNLSAIFEVNNKNLD